MFAGSALLALGTDTAGSVRMPASMTGTVGIKTTKHRWSTDGITPLSTTLDTPGVLSRSVADGALAFSAIDPHASHDPDAFLAEIEDAHIADFRLGVCEAYFEGCDPGIAEGVREACPSAGSFPVRRRRTARLRPVRKNRNQPRANLFGPVFLRLAKRLA